MPGSDRKPLPRRAALQQALAGIQEPSDGGRPLDPAAFIALMRRREEFHLAVRDALPGILRAEEDLVAEREQRARFTAAVAEAIDRKSVV